MCSGLFLKQVCTVTCVPFLCSSLPVVLSENYSRSPFFLCAHSLKVPFFDLIWFFFNICTDLCLSDVAGACGTVPALEAGATYQDFCSMDSAQNNKGRGVADLPLPLSLVYCKVEECLVLLSQRVGLNLLPLTLLCWEGQELDEVAWVFRVSVFLGKILVQPLSADETAGQGPKFSVCLVQC